MSCNQHVAADATARAFAGFSLSSKLDVLVDTSEEIWRAAVEEQRVWTEFVKEIDMKVAALQEFANSLQYFVKVWRSYWLCRLGEVHDSRDIAVKSHITYLEATSVQEFLEDCRDAIIKEQATRAVFAQQNLALPPSSTSGVRADLQQMSPRGSAFSESNESNGSWIKVQCSGSDGCFLPDTLFRTPEESFVKATALKCGDGVLSASGRLLKVLDIKAHDEKPQQLVELCTGPASLTVTASHRIMARVSGQLKDVRAEMLREGDRVFCTSGEAELCEVHIFEHTTKVVEVAFLPDEAVAAFLPPLDEICSKGRRFGPKIRRGSMCRRGISEVREHSRHSKLVVRLTFGTRVPIRYSKRTASLVPEYRKSEQASSCHTGCPRYTHDRAQILRVPS